MPILPGPPLILVGAIFLAWWEDFSRIGVFSVAVIGVLTLMCILIDIASSYLGAKKVGASRAALIGSIAGSLIGIFFLLPGIILGPFLGALVGEWWMTHNISQATKVGLGTWLGLLIGSAAKLGLAVAMVGVLILALIA